MVAESRLRIAVALTLLAPAPPLLFMGEEFGATTPFLFFCDFGPDLTSKVTEGRRLEFASFPEFSDPIVRATIPDPEKDETFQHSSLNWQESESEKGKRFLKLYKKLLTLRYLHISQRLSGIKKNQARYKRIGSETLQVSWVLADGARLHLIVNFGSEPSGLASPLKGDMIYSDPLFMGEAGMLRQSLPQSIVWLLDT
jgi:1,4-alpha-glucan branching enzyme